MERFTNRFNNAKRNQCFILIFAYDMQCILVLCVYLKIECGNDYGGVMKYLIAFGKTTPWIGPYSTFSPSMLLYVRRILSPTMGSKRYAVQVIHSTPFIATCVPVSKPNKIKSNCACDTLPRINMIVIIPSAVLDGGELYTLLPAYICGK